MFLNSVPMTSMRWTEISIIFSELIIDRQFYPYPESLSIFLTLFHMIKYSLCRVNHDVGCS